MLSMLLLLACEESKPCIESSESVEKIESNSDDAVVKSSASGGMSEKETELLKPFLDDLRIGVREWSSESVGICKGQSRGCTEYIGLNSDSIPAGKYMLRGEFQTPKLVPEEGWKVKITVNCEIIKKTKNGESKTSKSYSQEYGVNHMGAASTHGSRLSPLYSINSPSTRGEETCSWTIEANNLDAPKVWEGKYVIPYKG